MNKLSRLKWIPMLIKAYCDARVIKELDERTTDESAQFEGAGLPAKKSAAVTKPVLSAKSAPSPKTVSTPKNLPKLQKDLLKPVVKRTGQDKRGKSASAPDYNAIIRELRETQSKLNRLESIHEQLTEMQENLNSQLSELTSQIGARNRTGKESAPTLLADSLPTNRPPR